MHGLDQHVEESRAVPVRARAPRALRLARALLVALAALAAGVVHAQANPPEPHNVVNLQADAQREVDNDLLIAVMYAELTDSDAARLAEGLNRTINGALAMAQAYKGVRTRSGGYRTFPVYDDRRRLTQWRGRFELRLESADFEAASALIGKLQATLQVGGISFGVSPALRQKLQDELIAEAIGAFRARATIAQRALGGKSFRIRQISVNTGFAGPQPAFEARAASLQAAPAPQLEGGTSRVTVSASGSVEVD